MKLSISLCPSLFGIRTKAPWTKAPRTEAHEDIGSFVVVRARISLVMEIMEKSVHFKTNEELLPSSSSTLNKQQNGLTVQHYFKTVQKDKDRQMKRQTNSQIINILQFCRRGRSSRDRSGVALLDGDAETLKKEGCRYSGSPVVATAEVADECRCFLSQRTQRLNGNWRVIKLLNSICISQLHTAHNRMREN